VSTKGGPIFQLLDLKTRGTPMSPTKKPTPTLSGHRHTLQPKDFGWLAIAGKHPAVVISLDTDPQNALVIYGTSKRRNEEDCLRVASSSKYGKALRLTKDTYFYASNTRLASYSCFKPCGPKCPPGLFQDLKDLAAKALTYMDEHKLTQGLMTWHS
jgi:hypothetical protein